MKRIKQVLTERWYTWENARQDAMQDEEINMYADLDAGEPAYLPKEEVSVVAVESGMEQANWKQAQSDGISDALSQANLPPPSEASRPEVRA